MLTFHTTTTQGRRTPLFYALTAVNMIVFMLLFGNLTFAQLSEADSSSWRGRLSSGGTLITGNVERLLWITTLEASYVEPEQKLWGFKSSSTYQYGTFAKRLTESDLISRNFIYAFPKEWIYPYIMLWGERNYRRKFDFRYQAGVGGTVVLINEKHHTLKASLTLTNEQTTFNGNTFRDMPDLTSNVQNLWRGTVRLAGRNSFFEGKVRVEYEAWYQRSLISAEDYRYLAEAALFLPIAKNVSFRTALSYTRDNVVLMGVERADLLLTFGLSLALE